MLYHKIKCKEKYSKPVEIPMKVNMSYKNHPLTDVLDTPVPAISQKPDDDNDDPIQIFCTFLLVH